MCELQVVAEGLPQLIVEGSRIYCGGLDITEILGEDFIVVVVVTVICVMLGNVVERSLVTGGGDDR
jgi:hypothetical protein